MKPKQKIILGTVQFGMAYGINNLSGVPDKNELTLILGEAYKQGIDILDTAFAYGNAETRIGEIDDCHNFKIISKFSKGKDLEDQLLTSLSRLGRESIYGYLSHNADYLISNPGLWEILLKAKEKNQVQKIGFSLYTTAQLEQLLKMGMTPDLVQLPYSLLDRKFENYFNELKSIGTEIHVRSVFLQGLYFRDMDKLPEKLIPIKPSLERIQLVCKEHSLSIGSLALNFVALNKYIDKVVVGVECVSQLIENLKMVTSWQGNETAFSQIKNINIPQKELLNPANW